MPAINFSVWEETGFLNHPNMHTYMLQKRDFNRNNNMRQKKIENRCLLDKMVPKHLLQLIFLSVICIFSFKILELRFRHELYDSNDILGKEWQKRPFKAIWAVQAGKLKNSENFLKYLSYFWRSFFFTFSLTKKYNITVSLHRSSALKCWYKSEKTVNFGFKMYFLW